MYIHTHKTVHIYFLQKQTSLKKHTHTHTHTHTCNRYSVNNIQWNYNIMTRTQVKSHIHI